MSREEDDPWVVSHDRRLNVGERGGGLDGDLNLGHLTHHELDLLAKLQRTEVWALHTPAV